MSDRAVVGLVRVTAVVVGVLVVIGSAVVIAIAGAGAWWSAFGAFLLLFSIFFAVFVWLVIPQQPRNAVVWIMGATALCGGLWAASLAGAMMLVGDDPELLNLVISTDGVVPADLPRSAAWMKVFVEPVSIVAMFLWLTFGLLLFPDGRLPSHRWRWVGVLAAGSILAVAVVLAWGFRPGNTSIAVEEGLLLNGLFLALMLAVILSLVALVVRFRRSRGATREQFKWIVWGASIFVPTMVVASLLGGGRYEYLMPGPVTVATAIMLGSYGIAVGKYRLFDIDVVISRTVVYGTLAVLITGAYVVVVAGIGQLLGSGLEPNAALAITVTAVVAVAFQPMRRHLQRAANRIVYGKKATPYEVLSEFSYRVAAADTSLLGRVARSLVEGTGAEQAVVWVAVDDELVRTAQWPEAGEGGDDDVASFPIEQDGVDLGRLTLAVPSGQRLSDEDARLASDVASGMGLALRNQALTGALRTRVEELGVSRRRLVSIQDETRRQLERDLHDGAQQQLVALKVKLGLAQTIAEKEGGIETAAVLRQLSDEADVSVDALRDFARGVYPPLLEAEGLRAAITAQARRSPMPVIVQAEGIGRYGGRVEATVYFCVVEALLNVTRYAGDSEARVRLAQIEEALTFDVSDDGPGFDTDATFGGTGLINMEDRVGAANGSLVIDSAPGRGTTVHGSLPVGATT